MTTKLAINGGSPAVTFAPPHFTWPPPIDGLSERIKTYIDCGGPLSIVDRSGIYQELEDRFAALLGRKYAILTSSGAMALYSAFFGCDLKPGDEVISTVYSFHATATPLLHLGVKVVFCDVEADTGNIDPEQIEPLITGKTRALVTNHMWGHPVDAAPVGQICKKHGLNWIEDCSHAHFAQYNGQYVGAFGDAAVFSLQGNKLLTGGEGGILLTDDTRLYERATLLGHNLKRSQTCVKDPAWADILRTGFGLKLRMHPLAAVMVLYMLENCCFDWIAAREQTLARFSDGLAATGWVKPMARRPYVTSMGAHYGFKPRVDFDALGIARERLVRALQAEGLKISVPGSPPFHRLALFDADRYQLCNFDKYDNAGRDFPGVETYCQRILSLPTFTFPEQWPVMDQYIAAFDKVLTHRKDIP